MISINVVENVFWQASLEEDLLESCRRLRADLGVLQNNAVAVHQVRASKAGNLVIRVVPRHDAQQHTEWQTTHHCLTARYLDWHVSRVFLGTIRVKRQNVSGELNLAFQLWDLLTHFFCSDLC